MARGATHAASLSLGRFPRTRPGTLLLPDERTKGTHRGESATVRCVAGCQVTISGTPRPRTTARKQQAGQEDACNPVYPLFCSPPTSSKLTPLSIKFVDGREWNENIGREAPAGSAVTNGHLFMWEPLAIRNCEHTSYGACTVVVVGVRGESVVAVVVAITLQHCLVERKNAAEADAPRSFMHLHPVSCSVSRLVEVSAPAATAAPPLDSPHSAHPSSVQAHFSTTSTR